MALRTPLIYIDSNRQAAPGRSRPLRPLRSVPERLPHLSRTRRRDGFAARPNLSDGPRGRRRADQRHLPRTHRSVPGLPRLRNRLPFRRPYGRLVEDARAEIETNTKRGWLTRQARAFLFGTLLPSSALLTAAGAILYSTRPAVCRSWCALGLLVLLGRWVIVRRSRPRPRFLLLPRIGKTFPARGRAAYRVAFVAGCVANVSFRAAERSDGARPAGQWLRSGDPRRANLLRRTACPRGNPRRGAQAGPEEYRRASGGWFRRHYHQRRGLRVHPEGIRRTVGARTEYATRALQFAALTKDVTEFLASIELNPTMKPVQRDGDLSGFLPSGARPENSRAPRASCYGGARAGVSRDADGRRVLRQRRHLQRAAYRYVAADSGKEDDQRKHGRCPDCCYGQSGLHAATARRSRNGARGERVAHVVEILDEAYRQPTTGR